MARQSDGIDGPHQGQPILAAGEPLERAQAALLMLHGRGASAEDILSFDPDVGAVGRARQALPHELAYRVSYRVASGNAIEIQPCSFDLALFSWSL